MNAKTLFTVFLLAGCWLSLDFVVRGEPLDVAPREGILVLHSGGILRGAITRAGQEYYVGVGGGEIRLKANDVELACDNLDEAYQIKAAALPTGHVSEHATLAEWCLRHGLIGYAAKELVLAREADASFPRLKLLERRLDLAQHPAQPHVTHVPPKAAQPDQQSSDDIVRRLPPRSIEVFTSTIQPLLLNGCATAACHGTASNNHLRLERIALGRPTSYRISQRNLASVLSCVDLENPANSSLLTLPLGAHGTAAEAVFTRRDREKYRQLVAWVTDVTNNITPAAPNNVSTPAAPLLQTMNQRLPGSAAGQPKATPAVAKPAAANATRSANASSADSGNKAEAPSVDDSSAEESADEPSESAAALVQPLPGESLKGAQERRGHQFGAPVAETKPVDPFDPEIFNREFGNRR